MQTEASSASAPVAPLRAPAARAGDARRDVVYYGADECILVDGECLIRSLPAKILWRVLTVHDSTGRAEVHEQGAASRQSLNLPEWQDNLESRLLRLRRRLQQKCPDIKLIPRARGRFALELSSEVVLDTRP